MRNAHLVIRALAPLAVFGMVVACGGGDSADTGAPATGESAEMPFDVATAGHVSGMVMFEGEAPAPEPIDMSSEETCHAHWDGSPVRETVKVRDGHLADVFIYVKEGLDGMTFPAAGQAAVMDQLGCRYTPPVVGVMVGQNLTFRNSDGLLHNVNATPATNRPFNVSQPVNMETQRTFAQPEVMIPVRCDVHGWMQGYLGIVAHPYFGVTGEPGTFSLQDLPPGEYVIEAWHSQLGVQEQTITVATGETAEVTFTYAAEMLQSAVVPLGDPIDPHNHNPLLRRVGQGSAAVHAHAPAAAPGTR